MKSKILFLLLIFAGLSACTIFIWPTRYRYDHIKVGENNLPVRTDRFNADTEVLYPTGWVSLRKRTENADREIMGDDLAKITGNGSIEPSGRFDLDTYNGSRFVLSEITISISVGGPAQYLSMSDRKYRLLPDYAIQLDPQSASKFHCDLGFTLRADQTWTFRIVGAKGHPES